MGKKKNKSNKLLSGVAIPALVVSSIAPVLPAVAHAEEGVQNNLALATAEVENVEKVNITVKRDVSGSITVLTDSNLGSALANSLTNLNSLEASPEKDALLDRVETHIDSLITQYEEEFIRKVVYTHADVKKGIESLNAIISSLPEGETKTSFASRITPEVLATKAVEFAEQIKTFELKTQATAVVNALTDSAQKTDLTNRITAIQEATPATSFTWTQNADGATLAKFTGTQTSVIIPEEVYGYPVTMIADDNQTGASTSKGAFYNNKTVLSVVLPKHLKFVGGYAFGSTNLASVTFNEGLEVIGMYAFSGSKLTDIKLPSSLKTLGNYAFNNTLLTNVEFNDTLGEIGYAAFSNTKLTSVVLPEGLKTLNSQAFYGVTTLKEIFLNEGLETIGSRVITGTGVTTINQPNSIKSLALDSFDTQLLTNLGIPFTFNITKGEAMVHAYIESTNKDLVIPDTLFGAPIVEIKDGTGVANGVFANKNLKSVKFGANLKKIGKYAFASNLTLESVEFGESLEKIEANAFYKTGLTSLTLPSGLKTILSGAFSDNASLTKLTLNEGLETIDSYVFNNANIESVVMPSTLKTISANAFANNKNMQNLVFNNTIETLGENAFAGTNIGLVEKLPDSLISIGKNSLPYSAVGGNYKFAVVNDNKEITILGYDSESPEWTVPDTLLGLPVTTIGVGITGFGQGSPYVPENMKEVSVLGTPLKSVTLGKNVKTVAWGFFANHPVETLNFNDNLENIEEFAFMGSKFKSLVLPSHIKAIAHGSFLTNTLTDVTVLNKYMRYNKNRGTGINNNFTTTPKDYFGANTILQVRSFEGSTTQDIFKLDGFVAMDATAVQPTITSSIINNSEYENEVTPTFNIKDAETVKYTLDGKPYTVGTPIDVLGEHTLVVEAKNDSFTATKTYKFTVTLPTPTINTSLVNGSSYKNQVTPTFDIKNATDVKYTLNGQPYTVGTPITNQGENILEVVASNASKSATKTYTFNISTNGSPVLTQKISNKGVVTGSTLVIDLTPYFTDPENDKLTYEVTTSDTHDSDAWVTTKNEFKFRASYDGVYDVTIKATDGNSYSEAIEFTVVASKDGVLPPEYDNSGENGGNNGGETGGENGGENGGNNGGNNGGETGGENPSGPSVGSGSAEGSVSSEQGSLDKVSTYKEIVDVTLVGIGTKKKYFVDGLLAEMDLADSTITLKSTDGSVVSALYNGEDQTLEFEGLVKGFSNVQLTATDSKGNKGVALYMVDVMEEPNFGNHYISDGVIMKGLEAYVIPLKEVFPSAETDSITYKVTVSKDGQEPPKVEEPKVETPVEEVTEPTEPSNEGVIPEETTTGEETEEVVEPTEGTQAGETQLAMFSPFLKFSLATLNSDGSFTIDVPEGVSNQVLYTDDDIVVKLVNSRLVVEGKNTGNYNVEVVATNTTTNETTPITFKLEVKDAPSTGGEGENGGSEGGNTGGENGGSEGGNNGGNTGGENGGNNGGTEGGNNGGTEGGNTGGSEGGNTGGNNGGSTGGDGNTGGSNGGGSTGGGSTGEGSNGGDNNTGGSTGGNNGSGGTGTGSGNNGNSSDGGTNNGGSSLEDKLEDIVVDIDKNDKGDLVIDIIDKENIIGENGGTITITDDGAKISVNGVEKDIKIDLGDYKFTGKRAVHVVNGKKSTAMHYTTDNSLVITTHNLNNLVITSRESLPFKDLDPKWNQISEIDDLYNYIITTGTTATTYSPKSSITRTQFAVMVARALELTTGKQYSDYTLKDLDGKWYAKEVQALVDLGIIEGFSDGTFGGHKELSRQQAAAIITRMLDYMGVEINTTRDIKFADEHKISDYAKEGVHFLAQQDILVNGAGVNFNPFDNLTRDQMAKVLVRALQLSDFY